MLNKGKIWNLKESNGARLEMQNNINENIATLAITKNIQFNFQNTPC